MENYYSMTGINKIFQRGLNRKASQMFQRFRQKPLTEMGAIKVQKRYTQILIIYRFHICEFTYLLKLILNPYIPTRGTSIVTGHVQSIEKNTGVTHASSPLRVNKATLPCFIWPRTVKKCPFRSLFSVSLFPVFFFFFFGNSTI